jgi:heavy metal sensor kinase
MTLRSRLALVNVTVLLVALLLLAFIVYNQLVSDLHEQLDRELALTSEQALQAVTLIHDSPVFAPNHPQNFTPPGPEGFVRLLNAAGQITAGRGEYHSAPVLTDALQTSPKGVIFNQTGPENVPLRVYTRPLLAENKVVGYLQVGSDREEVEETLQTVRRSLLFGLPLTLLFTGLISLWAAARALRPLTTMTRSAAAISADDLTQRLPEPAANDEVRSLAMAFNATLDRLAAAFARQRRFTADASHELRTPVTAILGQAEYALAHPRSPESYQSILGRIQTEAERMQRLIGRMLALARVETGRQPLNFAPTDVAGLLHTLADTLQPKAAAQGLTLTIDAPRTLILTTDADSLTQILLNLLENAIHYTEQGQVEVSIQPAADQTRILVSDTGPGISAEHQPHLFQPFYRIDSSRSQSRGHIGLGLALAHELAQLLGGSLEVTSQPGQGTTFTLTLK